MQPQWIGETNPLHETEAKPATEFFFGKWVLPEELVKLLTKTLEMNIEIEDHHDDVLFLSTFFDFFEHQNPDEAAQLIVDLMNKEANGRVAFEVDDMDVDALFVMVSFKEYESEELT